MASYLVATAIVELSQGGPTGRQYAQQAVADAQAAMEGLLDVRRVAEYGSWAGLYYYDHLSDMQLSRRDVRQLALALTSPQGTPLAPTYQQIWYR